MDDLKYDEFRKDFLSNLFEKFEHLLVKGTNKQYSVYEKAIACIKYGRVHSSTYQFLAKHEFLPCLTTIREFKKEVIQLYKLG